jgi:hypothetical protein
MAPTRRLYEKSQHGKKLQQPRGGKKTFWGTATLVAIAIVIALVFYFAATGKTSILPFLGLSEAKETALPPRLASFEKTAVENVVFLTYADPEYGFSFKYPSGYYVATSTATEERFKLTGPSAEGLPELIRILATEDSYGKAEMAQTIISLKTEEGRHAENISNRTEQIGGHNAFIITFDELSGNYPGRHKSAFGVVDCGAFRVGLESFIPQDRLFDSALPEYMLYSIRCS